MAREVDGGGVTRIDLVEEFLPLGIEVGPTYIFGRDDFEAEWCQRRANRAGIVQGMLELLLWRAVVVLVDADHEGNALLGLRNRWQEHEQQKRRWRRAPSNASLDEPQDGL